MLLWAQDPNGLIKLIQAACTVETKPPFKDQTKAGPLGWIRVLNLTAMLTDADCTQHTDTLSVVANAAEGLPVCT